MKNLYKQLVSIALVIGLMLVGVNGWGQVSLTTLGSPVTYNFTGFDGNADPTDWTTADVSSTSNWLGSGTGTATVGGKYSFGDTGSGPTFEGSIGFLPSSTRAIHVSISFTNDTGSPIASFDIGYTAEHWRSANGGRNNGWTVDYQIESNGYNNIPALNYVAPNNIPTGGGPHGSSILSTTITATIGVGETIEIRFLGDNGTGIGSRQGVAIDDFSFTPNGPLPVDLLSFTATLRSEQVRLDWAFDNARGFDRFEVEHATDRRDWSEIGIEYYDETISRSKQAHYTHLRPANGNNYYRLRMVDADGTVKLSRVQAVQVRRSGGFTPVNTVVDAELYINRTGSEEAAQLTIVDLQGRVMETALLPEYEDNALMNLNDLVPGVYLLQVVTSSDRQTFKIVKK